MGRTKRKGTSYLANEYPYEHIGIKSEAVVPQRLLYSKMSALADEGIYPRCYNNSYWYTDYDGRGFDVEGAGKTHRPLTVDECEELCYGCPLLKLCYDFAVANDEKHGIWGGVNFGEDYDDLFSYEEEII